MNSATAGTRVMITRNPIVQTLPAGPEGDVPGDRAQQALFDPLGLDLDGLATVLAVHRIRVVAL